MQAILVAVCFAAAMCGAEAFQCYNCSLVTATVGGNEIQFGDKGCMDPFDSTGIQLVPCATSCTKAISSGETPSIRRYCYDEPSIQCIQLENFEAFGITVSQYCCSGDKCNNAGIANLSIILAIAAAFTALLF